MTPSDLVSDIRINLPPQAPRAPPGGLIGRRLRQWYLDVLGHVPENYKDKPPVVR